MGVIRLAVHAVVPAGKTVAVHAFFIGGILLMRGDVDAVERAEVLIAAVVLAVTHRTADTMVRVLILKNSYHLKQICRFRQGYCSHNRLIYSQRAESSIV